MFRVQLQCVIVSRYGLRVLALLSKCIAQIIFCIGRFLSMKRLGGFFILPSLIVGGGFPRGVVESFRRLGRVTRLKRLAGPLVAGLPQVLPFPGLGWFRHRQGQQHQREQIPAPKRQRGDGQQQQEQPNPAFLPLLDFDVIAA